MDVPEGNQTRDRHIRKINKQTITYLNLLTKFWIEPSKQKTFKLLVSNIDVNSKKFLLNFENYLGS